jgi:Contractile injection system tube protein/LysM domain
VPPPTSARNDDGPPTARGFQHARLEVEGGSKIECWFNPKEYTVQKANTWTPKPANGQNVPPTQFGGGSGRELSLVLLFAAESPDSDVVSVTDQLFTMMEAPQSQSSKGKNATAPPTVVFCWGRTRSFVAAPKSLSVQYTMFRPDGVPIRAQATLALMEIVPEQRKAGAPAKKGQNPTTRAIAGVGSRVVRDGDSLQSIANAVYGDPTRWRAIAEANGIDDPTRVRRGASLAIPTLDR